MKKQLIGTLTGVLAFSSLAGGWGWLKETGHDRVVSVKTAIDPKDEKEREPGAFENEDGAIYYNAFFKYKGTIEGDVKPRPGLELTWRFSFNLEGTRYPTCQLEWETNRTLTVGLKAEKPGWAYALMNGKERVDYRYGNFAARTPIPREFSWPEDLSAALDRLNSRPLDADIAKETYRLTLVFEKNRVFVRQNDVLTGSFAVKDGFYRINPKLRLSPFVRFLGLTVRETPAEEAYLPVAIDSMANCAGVAGETLDRKNPKAAPPGGSLVQVGGVPFRFAKPSKNLGYDNVDVGESYFFQSRFTGWSDWIEKRWPLASQHFPGRLAFAVPYGQYESLYVLAATDSARKDAIDTFTVQVHVPKGGAGFPKNFKSPAVPPFTVAAKGPACEVLNEKGEKRYLHLVEIPLDFAALQEFAREDVIQFELTKDVHPYRAFPDPVYGSVHAGGKPSAVHVFAATLKRLAVPVEFKPRQLANLFTEGEDAAYDATFTNPDGKKALKLKVEFAAVSWDRTETNRLERTVEIAPGKTAKERFAFRPKRFGHHDVTLKFGAGGKKDRTYVYPRTLSYVRKREYDPSRDLYTRGHMFGFWPWLGGHQTPTAAEHVEIAGKLGMESMGASKDSRLPEFTDEAKRMMEKYAVKCYSMKQLWYLQTEKHDDGTRSVKPEGEKLLESIRSGSGMFPKSSVQNPQFVNIFSEPGGLGTHGVPGMFYGEPWERSDVELNHYGYLKFHIVNYIRAIRQYSKDVKILMPWGDPGIPIPFLMDKDDPDLKELAGMCYDGPTFGRLPEAQITQNTVMHRMYLFNETWKKYRPDQKPFLMSVEGPHVAPVSPAYFDSEDRRAAHNARCCLILSAYGISKQFSAVEIGDCGDYWGEEQYGGAGVVGRIPEMNPHVMCSTFAALTRHLRHMEFEGWDELGSHGVYSLRYRDARSGKLLRVLWTVVGKREVKVKGEGLEVYDPMDNLVSTSTSRLNLTIHPIYVYGTDEKTTFELGEPDNSDSRLGPHVVRLGAAKDLLKPDTGSLLSKPDHSLYTDSFREMVRRYPAEMKAEKTDEGLSISMAAEQPVDRKVMPYYSAYACDVEIPGVAEKISLNVKGCSDWGRVVYELEDAHGEKWVSTGQKDYYNCDDQGARSYFVHDGWRLLRFALPGNLPYDSYRTAGTCWWGSYGGDGIVDYPLTLKRVYVERRPKTIYVNSLEKVPNFAPVVLGDLYAEYGSEFAKGEAAVAESRLRMPIDVKELSDPYAEAEAKGELPATELEKVEHPQIQDIDGRKGLFFFREPEGAHHYELYLSLRPDMKGATMAKRLRKSGERVDGLKPNTKTYAFIVWYDNKNRPAKPSPIFSYELKDLFSNK